MRSDAKDRTPESRCRVQHQPRRPCNVTKHGNTETRKHGIRNSEFGIRNSEFGTQSFFVRLAAGPDGYTLLINARHAIAQRFALVLQRRVSLPVRFVDRSTTRSQASAHAWQSAGDKGPRRRRSVAATVQISLQSSNSSCSATNSISPDTARSTQTFVSTEQAVAHSRQASAAVVPR